MKLAAVLAAAVVAQTYAQHGSSKDDSCSTAKAKYAIPPECILDSLNRSNCLETKQPESSSCPLFGALVITAENHGACKPECLVDVDTSECKGPAAVESAQILRDARERCGAIQNIVATANFEAQNCTAAACLIPNPAANNQVDGAHGGHARRQHDDAHAATASACPAPGGADTDAVSCACLEERVCAAKAADEKGYSSAGAAAAGGHSSAGGHGAAVGDHGASAGGHGAGDDKDELTGGQICGIIIGSVAIFVFFVVIQIYVFLPVAYQNLNVKQPDGPSVGLIATKTKKAFPAAAARKEKNTVV